MSYASFFVPQNYTNLFLLTLGNIAKGRTQSVYDYSLSRKMKRPAWIYIYRFDILRPIRSSSIIYDTFPYGIYAVY